MREKRIAARGLTSANKLTLKFNDRFEKLVGINKITQYYHFINDYTSYTFIFTHSRPHSRTLTLTTYSTLLSIPYFSILK